LLGRQRPRQPVEAVALAGHCNDQARLLGIGLDLFPQPADQHVDAAIERIGPLAAQSVEQIVAAQHPRGMTSELAQQRKFAAGEGNVAPTSVGEQASVEIERKIPEPDGRASRRQRAFGRSAAGVFHELGLGHVAVEARAGDCYTTITPPLLDYQTLASGVWKGPRTASRTGAVQLKKEEGL
jgi:hypothetical protein